MGPGLNRMLHIVAAATVWVWAAALCGLWGRVFGVTAPNLWLSGAMAMVALAVGLAAPGQFFRAAQALLKLIYPRRMLSMPPVDPDNDQIPQQMSRLLGVGLIVAAAGGLVSATGLRLAAGAVGWITSGFLLSTTSYLVMQVLVQGVAMVGWGVGAALVFQAQSLADGDDGPARGERVVADWLCGLAVAAGVLAWLWVSGVDLLAAGLLAGLVQVVIGVALIGSNRAVRVAPVESPKSVTPPSVMMRLGVVTRAAAAAWVAVVQLRALADFTAASMPAQAVVVCLTVGAAAIFAYRWRGKHFVRSGRVAAGAAVLAIATLATQLTFALLHLSGGPRAWLWIATAGQVFLAAALVLVLFAHRRRYLSVAGSPRRWMQGSAVGLAIGAAAGALGLGSADGRAVTLAALMVTLAGAVVAGIVTSRRTGRQLTWAIGGGVLLAAITIALTAASTEVRRQRRLLTVSGRWLTAWQRGPACGYLPGADRMVNWRLDTQVAAVLGRLAEELSEQVDPFETTVADGPAALMPGPRWLVAARRPLGLGGRGGLIVHAVAADPAIGRVPLWRAEAPEDMWPVLRFGRFQYHGVLYGPLRADHPSAPAVYNRDMIAAALARTAPGGVFILHVPCAGPDMTAMLAAAKTLGELAGELTVAIAVGGSGAEMLLIHLKSGPPGWPERMRDELARLLPVGAIVGVGSDIEGLWDEIPILLPGIGESSQGGGGAVTAADILAHLKGRDVRATGCGAVPRSAGGRK